MPPRAIWSGTVAFGLVTVPVRLFPAVQERTLRFRLLHEPDSSPIGYEKVCKEEGAERAYALLARAMDESGLAAIATFVMRSREHLAALRVYERAILLEQLHFADEIHPVD